MAFSFLYLAVRAHTSQTRMAGHAASLLGTTLPDPLDVCGLTQASAPVETSARTNWPLRTTNSGLALWRFEGLHLKRSIVTD
jgi:hypothetical protein